MPGHFYWPELDVDLAIESIEHPERFKGAGRALEGRWDRATGTI